MDGTQAMPDTTADPVARWAEAARIVAYRHDRPHGQVHRQLATDMNRVLTARRAGLEVTPENVAAWLAGRDAPAMNDDTTSPLHDAFLMALGLRYHEKKSGRISTCREELNGALKPSDKPAPTGMIEHRTTLLSLYEEAALEAMTRPAAARSRTARPEPKPRSFVAACPGKASAQKEYHLERLPYMGKHAERVGPANERYGALDDVELRHILETTNNPFEYLHAFRLQRTGMTQEEAAAAIDCEGTAYRAYEYGDALPTRDNLPHMKQLFRHEPPRYWDRFMELYVRTRASLMYGHEADDHHAAATMHMQHMPNRFWRAQLDQLMHGEQADDPAIAQWADSMQPMTTTGQYLRAVRLLLNIPQNALTEEIHASSRRIQDAEWNTSVPTCPTTQRIMDLYENLQQQIADGATSIHVGGQDIRVSPRAAARPFFDRELAMTMVPARPSRAQAVKAEASNNNELGR